MSKQPKPQFEPGTKFEVSTIIADKNGVLWHVDPEYRQITQVYPGEPLEQDEEGDVDVDTGIAFPDYVQRKTAK